MEAALWLFAVVQSIRSPGAVTEFSWHLEQSGDKSRKKKSCHKALWEIIKLTAGYFKAPASNPGCISIVSQNIFQIHVRLATV